MIYPKFHIHWWKFFFSRWLHINKCNLEPEMFLFFKRENKFHRLFSLLERFKYISIFSFSFLFFFITLSVNSKIPEMASYFLVLSGLVLWSKFSVQFNSSWVVLRSRNISSNSLLAFFFNQFLPNLNEGNIDTENDSNKIFRWLKLNTKRSSTQIWWLVWFGLVFMFNGLHFAWFSTR